MTKYMVLLACALLVSCADRGERQTKTSRQQLTVWAQDSTYYSWDGETPVLLLGAGNADTMYLDPDYETKLKMLAEAGGNWLVLNMWFATPGALEDRVKLNTFIKRAKDLNIQVDLKWPIFSTWEEAQSSTVGITQTRPATGLQIPSSDSGPIAWEDLKEVKEEARSKNKPLIQPRVFSYGQTAAEGIAGFNRALLAGAAAVRHAERPYGEGFSGPALASIRAARTVERLIPFWELKPAMEIVPNAAPNSVYAATDGKNGYVLYLPTAASVEVKLDVKPQVPLRVTVVGYLGTQKSEVLQPPYGESFVLSTEEPRGGWMVIKPL